MRLLASAPLAISRLARRLVAGPPRGILHGLQLLGECPCQSTTSPVTRSGSRGDTTWSDCPETSCPSDWDRPRSCRSVRRCRSCLAPRRAPTPPPRGRIQRTGQVHVGRGPVEFAVVGCVAGLIRSPVFRSASYRGRTASHRSVARGQPCPWHPDMGGTRRTDPDWRHSRRHSDRHWMPSVLPLWRPAPTHSCVRPTSWA